MTPKQLQKLGVPPTCIDAAAAALGQAACEGFGMGLKGRRARQLVSEVVRNPHQFETDPIWCVLAQELIARDLRRAAKPISDRKKA
jgi:hypothetical protein